jgi:CDP-diacylglycerol---serine O-phosphatidyltransferase
VADNGKQRKRFQGVPVRFLLPNMVTLIALCAGITGIRLAFEGRFVWAVAAIILAVFLDAVDGRLARMLKGTSRFGAELDSLADFVNFGVAPALVIYFWSLVALKPLGWIVCLMLSVACALRLARFNVALDDPNKPPFAANFFTGIPAPAGASLAMAPLYYGFLVGDQNGQHLTYFIAPLIGLVAVLMVSRVPTFSGKTVSRVPREMVVPILGAVALFVACLITYPWATLLAGSVIYAGLIPLGVVHYARLKRAHEQTLPKTDAE